MVNVDAAAADGNTARISRTSPVGTDIRAPYTTMRARYMDPLSGIP